MSVPCEGGSAVYTHVGLARHFGPSLTAYMGLDAACLVASILWLALILRKRHLVGVLSTWR